jgi:hypothetical protein
LHYGKLIIRLSWQLNNDVILSKERVVSLELHPDRCKVGFTILCTDLKLVAHSHRSGEVRCTGEQMNGDIDTDMEEMIGAENR